MSLPRNCARLLATVCVLLAVGASGAGAQSTSSGPGATSTVKGTQGARALAIQDLKDAGRTRLMLSCDACGVATSETAVTFVQDKSGTATTGLTSYTVTAGKTLRVQAITTSLQATSTTGVRVRFRLREGAACGVSSTLAWTVDLGVNVSGTITAPEGGTTTTASFPDGLEFPASTVLCFSELATTNTTAALSFTLVGFEY